ncbi:MAG: type II toxin-antitoxin system HicB family antitoxin [Symploca sp. SIO3E6]|nr:type II toxin-antitoxin system HicB family antitoxin [Caldora sp. SIO3E6]
MNQYSMVIQWSDEDQLFLVTIPEFIERVVMPCTHGKTREEAIRRGEEVIEMYVEAWQAEEEPIPTANIFQVSEVRLAKTG